MSRSHSAPSLASLFQPQVSPLEFQYTDDQSRLVVDDPRLVAVIREEIRQMAPFRFRAIFEDCLRTIHDDFRTHPPEDTHEPSETAQSDITHTVHHLVGLTIDPTQVKTTCSTPLHRPTQDHLILDAEVSFMTTVGPDFETTILEEPATLDHVDYFVVVATDATSSTPLMTDSQEPALEQLRCQLDHQLGYRRRILSTTSAEYRLYQNLIGTALESYSE